MKQAMQSLLALVNKYVKDHADRLEVLHIKEAPPNGGPGDTWSISYTWDDGEGDIEGDINGMDEVEFGTAHGELMIVTTAVTTLKLAHPKAIPLLLEALDGILKRHLRRK